MWYGIPHPCGIEVRISAAQSFQPLDTKSYNRSIETYIRVAVRPGIVLVSKAAVVNTLRQNVRTARGVISKRTPEE